MKKLLLPVHGLVESIDKYIDGGLGKDLAAALVSGYIKNQDLDLHAFFREFVEEEWIVLKLALEIKDQTNLLQYHLRLNNINQKVLCYDIDKFGVHLNVTN